MIYWGAIRHFEPGEFGEYVEKMDVSTIIHLDDMRHIEDEYRRDNDRSGIIITINEGWAERPGNPNSMHPLGRAIDCVIRNAETREPLPIVEQFLIAMRYPWGGVGFYPFWEDPGLHLDTRALKGGSRKATWWRNLRGVYLPIDAYFV